MKIRDLTRQAGSAAVSAWPPRWGTPFREGDTWNSGPKPGEGVLESVMRHEGDETLLRLTMRFDAREHTGILTWEGPPQAVALERLLRAKIGRGIREIGELDVLD
jgi:hypothetical protein